MMSLLNLLNFKYHFQPGKRLVSERIPLVEKRCRRQVPGHPFYELQIIKQIYKKKSQG
jgi:hypothetical protein